MPTPQPWQETATQTCLRLVARYGAEHAGRVQRGVTQVAVRWWPEDGDAPALADFCEANFLADPGDLATTFQRFETVLEQRDRHLHDGRPELTSPLDLDTA